MFGTESWQQICDRAANLESAQSKNESAEFINRIQRYLISGGPCTQVPIAEAMVNYRDEDSCQIFVPFVSVSSAIVGGGCVAFNCVSMSHFYPHPRCRT